MDGCLKREGDSPLATCELCRNYYLDTTPVGNGRLEAPRVLSKV